MNLITVLAENIVPVHLYLLHWGEKKLPLNSPTKPPLWFCRFHLLTGAFKQSKTCMIKKPWWHCIKKKGPVELPSRLLSNQKQGRFSSNLLVRESVETSCAKIPFLYDPHHVSNSNIILSPWSAALNFLAPDPFFPHPCVHFWTKPSKWFSAEERMNGGGAHFF